MQKKKELKYRIIDTFKNNFLVRNIVLAISIFIILLVAANILLAIITRHGQKYQVPDFSGMTLQEARNKSKEYRLRLEVIDSLYVPAKPKGIILEQYPKAGSDVKSKRRVFLTTNTFRPKMIPLPYVTGFSLRQAKNKLIGAGFVIDRLIYKSDLATNNILEQQYNGKIVSPQSDIMGEVGSAVTLVVGLNPVDPDPVVPGVIGLTVDQAKNKIWESGFNVGNIDFDEGVDTENMKEARVYSQSLGKLTHAMYGRSISLKLTFDDKKVEKGAAEAEKAAEEYRKEYEEKMREELEGGVADSMLQMIP